MYATCVCSGGIRIAVRRKGVKHHFQQYVGYEAFAKHDQNQIPTIS